MKLKSIYTKNGVLTHEYFVNESDKEEIVAKMNLDNELTDDIGELLSKYDDEECILIESRLGGKLMLGNEAFSPSLLRNNTSKVEEDFKEERYEPFFKPKSKK